jgi:hypothetical protein
VPIVILGAGLLVLLGLGLFVAGILTGVTALYWGCVAACGVASVLLVIARRRISAAAPGGTPVAASGAPAATAGQGAEPAGPAGPAAPPEDLPDPDVEEVEVTDLLLVVDLKDEVLVLDEHPRYHLADCVHLRGRTPIPLPVDEARTDGFTPCAVCEPDRNLAQRARARKHAKGT